MIIYRTFEEKDLDHVYSIYLTGYFHLYGDKVKIHADQFLKLFRSSLIHKTEGEMFIAEKDGVPVGFATIHKEPTNEWKFGPIIVTPSAQGQGIGYQLLQLCIDFARSKNVSQIYLKVHEHNENAINLYKKSGFILKDVIPSDIPGINYLKMIKFL
ncbi:MAG: GNAT family N-acetyltransferase [Candidatus Helarchaeota archaeon]